MEHWATPEQLVREAAPDKPLFCYRPARLAAAAAFFQQDFPARPFYAVKANPAAHVLDGLWQAGVRQFDVASEAEVEWVATRYPEAELAFLHPVKSRRAIARAYHEFGVRIFVLDTEDELQKILAETGGATDLTLLVRVAVSNAGATIPLAGKFGANADMAAGLIRQARTHASALGVSFHVGSQAMQPTAWATAMADLSRIITEAGVIVDIVDVGGGFPAIYADTPPGLSLEAYGDIVSAAFEEMMVLENAELWCEPGRAMVAEAESLLVKVELAKTLSDGSRALYLNEGSYGALYDAVHERWAFPMRVIAGDGRALTGARPYTLYGPTCDSADKVPDAVYLPEGLGEGDYIEFGNIGAYGRSMAGRFNGFGETGLVSVSDQPWPSLFRPNGADIVPLGVAGTEPA